MSEVRKIRKGDKFEANKGFIYEVVGDETESKTIRAKLIEQPELVEGQRPYSTKDFKFGADAVRRSWTLLSEGPAKRPNNRTTRVFVSDVRLGARVLLTDEGVEFVVKRKRGKMGVWTLTAEDGSEWTLESSRSVWVKGAIGRPMPKTVHYNPYADEGTVTFQYNSRPTFGSHSCGVVSNIDVYARDMDLVTCDQACGERARDDHYRRIAKESK